MRSTKRGRCVSSSPILFEGRTRTPHFESRSLRCTTFLAMCQSLPRSARIKKAGVSDDCRGKREVNRLRLHPPSRKNALLFVLILTSENRSLGGIASLPQQRDIYTLRHYVSPQGSVDVFLEVQIAIFSCLYQPTSLRNCQENV